MTLFRPQYSIIVLVKKSNTQNVLIVFITSKRYFEAFQVTSVKKKTGQFIRLEKRRVHLNVNMIFEEDTKQSVMFRLSVFQIVATVGGIAASL